MPLITKEAPYSSPRFSEKLIKRAEILDAFDRFSKSGVICVSAPAGYGKTISAVSWLEHVKCASSWLMVDSYDTTPAFFYRRFCSAISRLYPRGDVLEKALASPTFGASPIEHTIEAIRKIGDVAADSRERKVFVLDDLHLLAHAEVLKSLPAIVAMLPANVVTILMGRGRKVLDFCPEGTITREDVIGVGMLKFSLEEVKACFRLFGHNLGYQEARGVKGTSGGWPIALYAMAHANSLPERRPKEEILQACIRTHLWDQCDESDRTFLLKTAVVGDLTSSLCNALTGREDSAAFLDELSLSHSLITKIGPNSYAYHEILQLFLCQELKSHPTVDMRRLFTIASEYYHSLGNHYRAFYSGLRGDGESKAIVPSLQALFRYDNRNNSVAEHVHNLWLYFREGFAVPEDVLRENPYIYINSAWYYYLTGDADSMISCLDRLRESLPVIEEKFPDFTIPALLCGFLDHRKSLSEAVPIITSDKLLAGGRDQVQDVTSLTQNLPLMHRGVRDFSEFARDPAAAGAFERAFSYVLGRDYAMIDTALKAGILYERNELSEALDCAKNASGPLYEASMQFPEMGFCALMIHAAILDAMGLEGEAAEKRAAISAYLDEKGALYLYPNFNAYLARLRMMSGEAPAALEWLENYFVDDGARLELYRIYQHFTTARALMITEPVDKARAFLKRLADLAVTFDRPLDCAEALTLLAILEWHRGAKKTAIEPLEEALHLVGTHRFIRIFAQEGAAIIPLVKRLITITSRRDYKGELDPVYLKEIYLAAYERAKKKAGIVSAMKTKPIKLSRQQRLMIKHLAQGYRNADIAEATGLTLNTVKVHTALAYKKLSVSNSADAVLKAKELGLLEELPEGMLAALTREHLLPAREESVVAPVKSDLADAEQRGRDVGYEQGHREGLFAAAKAMLSDGMPRDLVIRYTGLTMGEITNI